MSRHKRNSERVYYRQLPGGGYVSIEVTEDRSLLGAPRYRGEVVVERRIPERRDGHVPPRFAETRAATVATILHALFPMVQSNVAIANACLDHAADRPTLVRR